MSDTGSTADPLRRLSRAVEALLEHREHGGESAAFLAQHADLRDLLEPMLGRVPDDEPQREDHEQAARYLGDFRLLREIGRGGMGVVFEAEQVSLGRRVALKVLAAHPTLSPVQIERFRREATAAARLSHPGIVPIHAVGQHDGTHFFAMELIEGRDLHTALEAVKRGTADDLGVGRGLSAAAQAAEVVAQAAAALHHAHELGVIHRDIKPHNILIGDDGTVRLVDFGLAKDLDRDSLSHTGEFAGTPQYVSPEQALGNRRIDHRTDVFSLGVVLYEVLARQNPFEAGGAPQQTLSAVIARDPAPLRKCHARVPIDLEVVCRKALEKHPDDRYQSAGELAADLRRFLRHEPIEATRPSLLSRALKLARRRRGQMLAAASGVVLLAAALAFAVDAVRQGGLARSNLASARATLDQLFELMTELDVRNLPGGGADYRRQVEGLVKRYDELIQGSTDPLLRSEASRAYLHAADSYQMLARVDEAHAMCTRAVDLSRRLVIEYPDEPTYRLELARALYDRATCTDLRTFADDRAADLDAAVELLEPLLEQAAPGSLLDHTKRCLSAAYTTRAADLRLRAPGSAPTAERETMLNRALALSRDLPEQLRDREGRALTELASVHAARRDSARAIELLEQARERGERLLAAGTRVRMTLEVDLIPALRQLGINYWARGDMARATGALRRAIELASGAASARDSVVAELQMQECRVILGKVLLKTGQAAESEQLFERAQLGLDALHERLPERTDVRAVLADLLGSKTSIALRAGELGAAAERVCVQAISHYRAMVDAMPTSSLYLRDLAAALGNLAVIERMRGDCESAAGHAREAVALQERAIAANPNDAKCRAFLAVHFNGLLPCLSDLQQHAELAAAATRFAAAFPDDAHVQMHVAQWLCKALELAQTRGDPVPYGEQAVGMLRDMVDKGMAQPASLAKSDSLAPVHSLPAFRALVEER